MDLKFLDKKSQVTPLLVRLYDSQKLETVARDNGPESREVMLEALRELMGMEVSPRESELIADVLIDLLRQTEKDLRKAVAERLAVMDDVPLRLILHLSNDSPSVAAPILRQSTVLSDMDLIYIIQSNSSAHWREIAKRSHMGDEVIDALAETKDFDTAVNLAENTGIKLTAKALGVLSDLAQESDVLAMPLLRRDEVPAKLAETLYEFVGFELKQFILKNYDVDTETLLSTVDDVVLELVSVDKYAPSPSMIKAAQRFKEKGLLTQKLMIGTLRRGQIAAFIAQLSLFSDIPPETVEQALKQSNGKALAVFCKAYDIPKADYVSIYLLTRVMREQDEEDVSGLQEALNYFYNLKKEIALGILGSDFVKFVDANH